MILKRILILTLAVLSIPSVWGGRRIVPADYEKSAEFRLAAQFLNRYATLLDTVQTQQVTDMLRRTKEDGFRFVTGNNQAFQKLNGSENFRLSFANGVYTASWSANGRTKVECTFPANIGLLTFSNKIDLEQRLINGLSGVKADSVISEKPVREISGLKPVAFTDFYIEDKGFYITPRLKHQLVFQKTPDRAESCELLTDNRHYQLESLANMMLSGYSVNPHPLNVKINQYGYKNHAVSTTLAAIYQFLAAEGSTPYWGIDTFDGTTAKGLWIWINTAGGYAHMLTVTTPVSAVDDDSPIEAKLHCYLRLDNLKSLFEEYPDL